MNKYLIVWPKSEDIIHTNYHYTQFGEVVNYLKKHVYGEIFAIDCDFQDIDICDYIKQNRISKVVMELNYENASNAFLMADKIKNDFNIPILAYGSIPLLHPKLFLDSSFDAIYYNGDFEICIKSFLEDYDIDASINDMQERLKGMRLIRNNLFYNTQNGEYIDSNDWGISKECDVPIKDYDRKKGKNRYVINLSRGCPFGCPHCLIPLSEGKIERRRSINNLRDSLKFIKKDYSHFKIWAANFTLNKDYVNEFCKMISKEYPELTWECATRINLVKDFEMLKQMHNSGCTQITLGIEGLKNGIMIGTKFFTPDETLNAIKTIQKAGINVKGCIMFGMPNQTKEDIIDTLDFLKNNHVIARPTVYTPYHHIPENITIHDLANYNRKTYENNTVQGVNSKQLIDLVKNPYNYEDILELTSICQS